MYFNVFTSACGGLFLVATCTNGSPLPSGDQVSQLQLTAQQLSPDPLPFQGIRVRLTIHNPTRHTQGPLQQLDHNCYVAGIKEPNAVESKPIRLTMRPTIGYISNRHDYWCRFNRLSLKPNQKETVSCVFTSFLSKAEDFSSVPRVPELFTQPGEYILRIKYRATPPLYLPSVDLSCYLTVHVRVPKGIDRDVYYLFLRDNTLRGQILDANVFREFAFVDDILVLEELVNEYPDSSYTDYIRMSLLWVTANLSINEYPQGWDMRKVLFGRLQMLKDINCNDFPYAAEALCILSRMASDRPTWKYQIEQVLTDYFTDDIAWLEYQSQTKLSNVALKNMRRSGVAEVPPRMNKPNSWEGVDINSKIPWPPDIQEELDALDDPDWERIGIISLYVGCGILGLFMAFLLYRRLRRDRPPMIETPAWLDEIR